MRRDIPHSTHVGGERVHLVDAVGGLQAIFPTAQVQQRKIVRRTRLIFGMFQISAAYPVALFLEIPHQMMADEPTGSCDKNSLHVGFPPRAKLTRPISPN